MSEQLKPCPFCREKEKLHFDRVSECAGTIDCDRCQAIGPEAPTKDEAISAWNTRPEAAQVRVKALTWSTLGADPSCIAQQFPYQIWPHNGGSGAPDDPFIKFNNFRVFEPFMMNCVGDEYETLDEAKAAAQADFDRRIRAALEPDTVTDELSKSIADFASRQEPLGAEFEQVLADNIEELYETQPNTAADTVTGWQDISTAPHGVEVLLYCPDQGRPTNRERIELGMASFGKQGDGWSNVSHHSWATHWMPLPPAPEKEG